MKNEKRFFFSPWLDKISTLHLGKKTCLLLFLLLAVVQLTVSVYPSFRSEAAARSGQEYKFKTEAFDPADPFRGRYLQFRLDTTAIKNRLQTDAAHASTRQICYLTIAKSSDGIAYLDEALPAPSADGVDFIKARFQYGEFNLPLGQYFLDETAAPAAEKAFFAHPNDCYILLKVQKGTTVVTGMYVGDLLIDQINY